MPFYAQGHPHNRLSGGKVLGATVEKLVLFSKNLLEQYNFFFSFVSNFLVITGSFHLAHNQVFMWHIFIVKQNFSCSIPIFSYSPSFPVRGKLLKRI